MSGHDERTQQWIDAKPPERPNGPSEAGKMAASAAVQEAQRGAPERPDMDSQLALDGVSREKATTVPRNLFDKFGLPPFSVLDTRQGYWQDRKRAWLSLGIKSEVGRDDKLTFSDSIAGSEKYGKQQMGTTSVFDPVLTELAYQWFCPPGGRVLDPFAGGSVRGVVAAALGYQYFGTELRTEQVDANRAQAAELFGPGGIDFGRQVSPPRWAAADALRIPELVVEPVDYVFSCPPYADLEVYSDDPRDISNMPYEQFVPTYARIIHAAVQALRQDRFACFVIAEVRDPHGYMRGFVHDTVGAFEAAGARYYNEAILVNNVGTAAVRANNTFEPARKLVKLHQQALVFVKGDPRRAAAACKGEA